jgi:hypothetical protein
MPSLRFSLTIVIGQFCAHTIELFVRLTFLASGLIFEAVSGYMTIGYFVLQAGTGMAWMGQVTGLAFEVLKFFITPLAWIELREKKFSGVLKGFVGLSLMAMSFVFSIGFIDSKSDALLQEAESARAAQNVRKFKIESARQAIQDFDRSSEIDVAAMKVMVQQDFASRAIKASDLRRNKRDILVQKYNEALSIQCVNIPDVGEMNKIYISLANAFHTRTETARLWFNIILNIGMEIWISMAVSISGYGTIIYVVLYQKNSLFKGVFSPKNPEKKADFEREPVGSATVPAVPHWFRIGSGTPLKSTSPASGDRGVVTKLLEENGTVAEPFEDPAPVVAVKSFEDLKYAEMLKTVQKVKLESPEKYVSSDFLCKHLGVRKERVLGLFNRGVQDGFFSIKGSRYDPTDKLLGCEL